MSDETPDTTGLRQVPDLLAALQRSVDAAKAARAAHPTPDASPDPAVVTPDAGDVEVLAGVVRRARMVAYEDGFGGWLWKSAGSDDIARAILASDWLANHVAATREADRAEVAEWKRRRDAAVEQCRFLHQDGKTREQWHLDNCGAMHLVRAVERVADEWGYISDDVEYPTRYDMWRQLRDTLTARTFDRDPQRTRAEAAEERLAGLVAQKAEAWDEGWTYAFEDRGPMMHNPYRAARHTPEATS